MLNIFISNKKTDKEKFIYESITQNKERTIVVVPDRYKVIAENNALYYMGSDILFDVEILSRRKLGSKILSEFGLEKTEYLNEYGRLMLVHKLIKRNSEELKIFSKISGNTNFTTLISNFISEFKSTGGTLDDIGSVLKDYGEEDALIFQKLRDLQIIIKAYEEELEKNEYKDHEDNINTYTNLVQKSDFIKNREIWIYNFIYEPVTFVKLIGELSCYAKNVNIVIDIDETDLGELFKRKIINTINEKNDREAQNIKINIKDIDGSYNRRLPESMNVAKFGNIHEEAENVAMKVLDLVRDEGYRMKDIAVLFCDDKIESLLKRRLFEYGIVSFFDERKSIAGSKGVNFVIHILESISNNYRTENIIEICKSGILNISDDDADEIERYVSKYNIKYNMWEKPFKYGLLEYGEKNFNHILELQKMIMDILLPLKKITEKTVNMNEFIKEFIKYLDEKINFRDKLKQLAEDQNKNGLLEASEITNQVYDGIIDILEQVKHIIGDERFELKEFIDIFYSGISAKDIGTIPYANDGIILGNISRTLLGNPKIVFIACANEGSFPKSNINAGIFTDEEIEYFANIKLMDGYSGETSTKSDLERIYNIIYKPEKLYVSYAISDGEGETLSDAETISDIKNELSQNVTIREMQNSFFEDVGISMIGSEISTLKHLMKEKRNNEHSDLQPYMNTIENWYKKEGNEYYQKASEYEKDTNEKGYIGKDLSKILFAKNDKFTFSPSRIEKYQKCPFNHFLTYGISVKEERSHQGGSREIGDIYHNSLSEFIKKISQMKEDKAKNISISDYAKEISDQEVINIIDDILEKEAEKYHEGLMTKDNKENYHLDRIRKILNSIGVVIVRQIKQGKLNKISTESNIDFNSEIKPIKISVDGEDIYIKGRIDRVDFLKSGGVRVIDYKTGSENFDKDKIVDGYQIQLMVYLESMLRSDENLTPGGIFYFKIQDDIGKKQKSDEERFKLDGAIVNEDIIFEESPFNIVGGVTKNKDGSLNKYSYSKIFNTEYGEFKTLRDKVMNTLKIASKDIIEGNVNADPLNYTKKSKTEDACQFCNYKSICRFDEIYKGNKKKRIIK